MNKPLHIVHVTGYYPPHLGGMEYRTKDLAENFAKRGHRVDVITSDIGCRIGKLPSTKNLRIHYLRSWEIAHTPLMPGLFWKLLTLPKNCIVHLHISQAFVAEVTYLVCKVRRIPYIAHMHLDVEASGIFGVLLPLYKKLFLKTVLRQADAITVLTEDYKDLVHKKYDIPFRNIIVIPNGTYFTIDKHRSKEVHKPIRVLSIGRLSSQKNFPLVLEAVRVCIYRYKLGLYLQIAGSGEKEQELKQLVKDLHLEKYVMFLGHVSLKETQKLYNTSDIFILSSKSESFGSVLIEAMACGVPVIATRIPAVRNIVKDGINGLLVYQTPEALAKAIYTLVTNLKLRTMLAVNGLKDSKQYRWETVTDQYRMLYQSILRKKNI